MAVLAAVPNAAASLGNTGVVDPNAFLPKAEASKSDLSGLEITGGTASQKDNVRSALGELVWPVQASSMKIVIDDGKKLPADAAAVYAYPSNVIYLRDSVAEDPAGSRLSHVLAHELGHMLDSVYLDARGRTEFLAARGFSGQAEWQAPDADWTLRPVEDFAEVFAALDAPSSAAPIATKPGRIADVSAMRALIGRYQTGPGRRMLPLKLATAAAVAREAVESLRTNTLLLGWLLCIAAVTAVSGAHNAIQELPYRTPRRRLTPTAVPIR
jgi:hypothetical protein